MTKQRVMGGWPSLNRTAAVGMVLLQAVAVTLLMKPILLPAAAVALAGWMAPQFRLVFNLPVKICFMMLGLATIIRHQLGIEDFVSMGFIGSKIAYEISCLCIACQLLLMFVRKYAQQLPIWYLALSGTSIVFSGDIRVTYTNNFWMLCIVLAYMVCWTGFAISCRTTTSQHWKGLWFRQIAVLIMLVAGLFSARLLSLGFQKYSSRLEFWMTEYLYHGRITSAGNGFSAKGGLHDIVDMKSNDGDSVALKIQATFFPDYLRGRVFTIYSQQRWQPSEPSEIMESVRGHAPIRPLYPNEYVYQLEKKWPDFPYMMTVWPCDTQSSAHFFLPLGAAVLGCDSSTIKKDPNGIVERDSRSYLDSYVALIGEVPQTPPDSVNPIFLSLPNRLSSVVTRTAQEVFTGAESAAEKMQAVEEFFQNNFTYAIGFRAPRGSDRLAYFLSTRSPAHCEYFATATTILLRIAGVPARYVTGYVATGINPIDSNYYAMKKDAHAWVEAYDDVRQQWVIVESTPVEGVPTRSEQPIADSTWSAGTGAFMKFSEFIRSGVLWVLGEKYAKWILVLMPTFVVIVSFAQLVMRNRLALWRKESRLNPAFAPLVRERIRMDRFLARRGFQRPPEESLLHFARRLETAPNISTSLSLANWYRQYVAYRFQDRPISDESVEELGNNRRHLIRTTKVSP